MATLDKKVVCRSLIYSLTMARDSKAVAAVYCGFDRQANVTAAEDLSLDSTRYIMSSCRRDRAQLHSSTFRRF